MVFQNLTQHISFSGEEKNKQTKNQNQETKPTWVLGFVLAIVSFFLWNNRKENKNVLKYCKSFWSLALKITNHNLEHFKHF